MLKSPENKNCYQYLRECTEIYDDVYDDLDFDFKNEDVRIVMDFSG